MRTKVEVQVTGTVSGFPYEDETDEQAKMRLVLDAEMHGNDGHARIHLAVKSTPRKGHAPHLSGSCANETCEHMEQS